MEDSELKKLAVSQYQLKKFLNYISSKLGIATESSEDTTPTNLYIFEIAGGNFIYDSDKGCRYNDSYVTLQRCTEESAEEGDVTYGVFKVNDVDKYVAFTITEETADDVTVERFTYYNSYTSSDLYSAFKSLFEIGTYATVYKVENKTSFYSTSITDFIDGSNRLCRFSYVTGITYSDVLVSTGKYLIAVNQENTQLWLYTYDSSTGKYKFTAKYTNTSNSSVTSALSAIVDCATTIYDSTIDYPSGSLGAQIALVSQKVRKVLDASTDVSIDATATSDDEKYYINVDANTPDEVLDWRGQENQLNVYVNATCRSEVTIFFDGAHAVNAYSGADNVTLQSIGDIDVTDEYEYCMVLQDNVYIIAPLSNVDS